jgi:hypothetical protein
VICTVTLRLLPVTIALLAGLRPVTFELPLCPLHHQSVTDAAQINQSVFNSEDVVRIASEKVSDLIGVQFVSSTIVLLRSAFEHGAPNPHGPLDLLLGLDCGAHELLVAHHAGVVAEPAAHAAIAS